MSRTALIALVVGTVLLMIIGGVGYKLYRQSMISETEAMLARGNYQQVIDQLESQVTSTSGNVEERVALGRAYYYSRQYDKALQVLQPLLEYGRLDARAVSVAGWIALEQENYISAQERFHQLATLGREAESAAGLAGVSYVRSEGYRKADLSEMQVNLERALALGDPIPETYLLQAEWLLMRQQYDQAIKAAQNAMHLRPHWAEPYVMLGRVYLLHNQNSRAKEAFENALQRGAQEDVTRLYLARSTFYEGHPREALAVYDQLIASNGETVREALEDAAKIHIALGELETAQNQLEKAWEIKHTPNTGIQLYELLARQEKWNEAERALNALLGDFPFVMEAQLEQANRTLEQGNLDQAYTRYHQVLSTDSSNYLAYFNLGCIALMRGDYYQAPDFFRAAGVDNNYFPALINYALSLLAVERETEALPLLQELVKSYPNNAYVYRARALERFLSGYSDVALQFLNESLQDETEQASSYIIQGEIALRMFQFGSALDSFAKAVENAPDDLRAQVGLAHANVRMANMAEAEDIYRALLKRSGLQKSMEAEAQNGVALVEFNRGDVEIARGTWNRMRDGSSLARQLAIINTTLISASQPTEEDIKQLVNISNEANPLPEGLFNLSLLLDRSGREDEAVKNYAALIERFPSYLPGLFNYAEWNRERGRIAEAIGLYERAQKVAPNRVDVLNNEAAAVMQLNNFDRADELLAQASATQAHHSQVQFNQALVALHKGDLAQAQVYLDQLQQGGAAPGSQLTIQGLILALEEQWSSAEKIFNEVGNRTAGDPYALLNSGVALAKQGQFQQAEEVMQAALSLDSRSAMIHRSLGLLYCQMGLYDAAEDMLQSALRLDSSMGDLEEILSQIRGWLQES